MSADIVHVRADAIGRPETNPFVVYLATLSAGASRNSMLAALKTVAGILGHADAASAPWHELRYPHMQALKGKLGAAYAPATANRYCL